MGHRDVRQPGSHAPSLTHYQWGAEHRKAWIQPGRSLSGFSVQLPTPHEAELYYLAFWESMGMPDTLPKDPPLEAREAPQPDLADIDFEVALDAERCAFVRAVELDQDANAAAAREDRPRHSP